VSDGVVSGTAPLSRVMDTTGEVSSDVKRLTFGFTGSSPKAVLAVEGHALNLSVNGTSHGSAESTVALPGGSFMAANGVSSGGMGVGSLAVAVLDTADGISKSSVVTALPSIGFSVGPLASGSVSDHTLAVALTSSSCGV
jgi:hypothetical protein